jgi:hypothetical protein
MKDKTYSIEEVQDRIAIEDLYDRQLEAAEAFDFPLYDTTFSDNAELDLSDFGLQPCQYPDYREWLAKMREAIVYAQRIRGGLSLKLDGKTAHTRVPVTCHVGFRSAESVALVNTGIFYEDSLEKLPQGWRIVRRRETLSWSS